MSTHPTHAATVAKLRRAGLVVVSQGNDLFAAQCQGNGQVNVIEWYRQGDSAVSLCVRRENDHDDPVSDYSAGSFTRSIAQALAWAQRL